MKQFSVRTSKTTFVDGAYHAICKAILSHELKPGDRLRSKELAALLSISRTPVERALERLAGEGLVEFRPGEGPHVVQPSVDNILELYDLRLLLELYGSARAVHSPNEVFLSTLNERLRDFERESAAQNGTYETYQAVSEADKRLHLHLLSACRGSQVRDIYSQITTRIMLTQRASFGLHVRAGAIGEHLAIYRAFEAWDAAAVADAVRFHIEAARDRFIESARENGIEVPSEKVEDAGAAMKLMAEIVSST